jgi:2,3-bisphosphoglycerate-independent phosphoglycerate mutase
MEEKKAIFIVLDGLGDRPTPILGGKTPLQAATKPTIDSLATQGSSGIIDVVAAGVPAGSDVAHLHLFGYDYESDYPGRGTLEALGVDLPVGPGDVAFRGNFAHIDAQQTVLDRRAGRDIPDADEFIDALNGLAIDGYPDVEIRFKHSTEQRVGVVLHGPGLSSAVSDVDPGKNGYQVKTCIPLDGTAEAERTAGIVNVVIPEIQRILGPHPANTIRENEGRPFVNAILFYGPGTGKDVVKFQDRYRISAACVTGNGLIRGLCSYLGIENLPCEGATGTFTTDLVAKMDVALDALRDHDFVFIHVKATDSCGHDRQSEKKRDFIERFDGALAHLLETYDLSKNFLALTGDHSTPATAGEHTGDPVPFVLAGPTVIRDGLTCFDETGSARGYFSRFNGKCLMPIILNKLDKLEKFGA